MRSAQAQDFDVDALFAALEERRRAEGLSWAGVAAAMWDLSGDLNRRRPRDHPVAVATLTGMPKRRNTSCQHALFMLRWLGRPPEDFVIDPRPETVGVPLPVADSSRRLRWDLSALHLALNDARREHGATWEQAARRLHCTPHQLTGLRAAKFATGMRLAVRICQSLARPAADFVHPASW